MRSLLRTPLVTVIVIIAYLATGIYGHLKRETSDSVVEWVQPPQIELFKRQVNEATSSASASLVIDGGETPTVAASSPETPVLLESSSANFESVATLSVSSPIATSQPPSQPVSGSSEPSISLGVAIGTSGIVSQAITSASSIIPQATTALFDLVFTSDEATQTAIPNVESQSAPQEILATTFQVTPTTVQGESPTITFISPRASESPESLEETSATAEVKLTLIEEPVQTSSQQQQSIEPTLSQQQQSIEPTSSQQSQSAQQTTASATVDGEQATTTGDEQVVFTSSTFRPIPTSEVEPEQAESSSVAIEKPTETGIQFVSSVGGFSSSLINQAASTAAETAQEPTITWFTEATPTTYSTEYYLSGSSSGSFSAERTTTDDSDRPTTALSSTIITTVSPSTAVVDAETTVVAATSPSSEETTVPAVEATKAIAVETTVFQQQTTANAPVATSTPIANPVQFEFTGMEPSLIASGSLVKVALIGSNFGAASDATVTVNQIQQTDVSVNSEGTLLTWTINDANIFPTNGNTVDVVVTITGTGGTSTASKSQTLTFYDPATNTIKGITPHVVGLESSDNQLVINGLSEDYTSFGPASCIFKIAGSVETSDAVYSTSDNTYTCIQPPLSPGVNEFTVDVLYAKPKFATIDNPTIENLNRPEYFVPTLGGTSNKVYAAHDAPVITGATFTETGNKILVEFDKDIEVVEPQLQLESLSKSPISFDTGVVDCMTMFDVAKSTGRFANAGDGKHCSVVKANGKRGLLLQLSGAFAKEVTQNPIVPGDTLVLVEDTIVSADGVYSRASIGSVVVGAPSVIRNPVVDISAPQFVSSCFSGVTLDTSRTSGALGRNWQSVSFTFQTTNPDTTLDAELTQILDTASASLKDGSSFGVQIDMSKLTTSTYTFEATFTNWLGGSKSASTTVQNLGSQLVPRISIISSAGTVDVDAGEDVQIQASAKASCGATDVVQYQWSSRDSSITFTDAESKRPVILVPKHAMKPQSSYTFDVAAGYDGQSQVTFSITIQTGLDKLKANSGTSFVTGEQNSISLAATIINPSYATFQSSLYTCIWTCSNVNGASGECQDQQSGQALVLDSKCSGIDLTGKLAPGGKYMFQVTVTNTDTGNRVVGNPSYVQVVSGQVPLVNLVTSELSPGPASRTFSITSSVELTTVSSVKNLQYQWSSVANCDGETYATIALQKDVTTTTEPTGENLKFKAGAMQAQTSYCFQLDITDSQTSAKGSSYVVVTTREIPSGGSCSVSPAKGQAFVTDMSFACNGWETDSRSYPLKYKFYLQTSPSTDFVLLQDSTSPRFSSLLPEGSHKMKIDVIDNTGSSNLIEQALDFTVTAPTRRIRRRATDLSGAITYISDAATSFTTTKNVDDATKSMGIGAGALPSDVSSGDAATLAKDILDLFKTVLEFWIMNADNSAPMAGSILSKSVGSVAQVDVGVSEAAFELVKQVNDKLSTSTGCYPYSTATLLARVLDIAVGSLQYQTQFSTVISSDYNNVVDSISTCIQKSQVCGESAFQHSGDSISITTGKASTGTTLSFCSSTLVSYDAVKCVRYTCGQTSVSLLPSDFKSQVPEAKAIASHVHTTSLVDDSNGNTLTLPGVTSVRNVIPDTSNLVQTYSLTGYTNQNKNDYQTTPFAVELSYANNGNSFASIDSSTYTSLSSIDAVTASGFTFTTGEIGDFIIAFQDNDDFNGSTGGGGGDDNGGSGDGSGGGSIGVAAGAAGGIGGVLLIAGAAYAFVHTKNKRKLREQNGRLVPTSESEQEAQIAAAPASDSKASGAEQPVADNGGSVRQASDMVVAPNPEQDQVVGDSNDKDKIRQQKYYEYVTDFYANNVPGVGTGEDESSSNTPLSFEEFCTELDLGDASTKLSQREKEKASDTEQQVDEQEQLQKEDEELEEIVVQNDIVFNNDDNTDDVVEEVGGSDGEDGNQQEQKPQEPDQQPEGEEEQVVRSSQVDSEVDPNRIAGSDEDNM